MAAYPGILLALCLASGAAFAADEANGRGTLTGTAGAPGAETDWAQPAPVAPQLPSTPVRSRPAKAKPPEAAKHSPYLGLRALSLAAGEGKVQTADGMRVLRPGDLLGSDVVSAVDVGLLVLRRRAASGGDARVVIRFDAQGKPTVRIYHAEDPTRAEPRPAQ